MTLRRSSVHVFHRLTTTPFASAIALIGINSAFNLWLRPNSVPTHALLSPFDYLAAGIYAFGGLAIIIGISIPRADVEAAGCVAFAGGAAINAVTAGAIIGIAAWNTVAVLSVFMFAALVRAWHIWHGQVLILAQTPKGNGDLPRVITNGD